MDRPIGVIDSGFGGLTVAKEIMRQLPKEKIVYIGDSARCPYGPRSTEEVRQFTWEMIYELLNKQVKMIVIACNTATAVVLEEARIALEIPVIGVIQPGAVRAMQTTKNQHIAVIGTTGTISSHAYTSALTAISEDVQVESLACPLFVPLVEQGILNGQEAEQIVATSLEPLADSLFDTLILGCTHYPLLKPVIEKAMPNHVHVISSGEETAREVSSLLHYHNLNRTAACPPIHRFYTTGEAEPFREFAERWLTINAQNVDTISLKRGLANRVGLKW
ncbi:glutamate racemase [Alkalihalobacillus xiaoxiensis]|uniref:Glutamate racemase n=1 Tax=Shouchella xiaoxiensis TaxID=766895 RepID=A0ABS2STG3_9BACI|nr:glutamate racemase [Shouchella xiaoxiensis]MBM7838535.1 glutamate racemase [Shouchella xiaoxiensis]